MPRGFHPAEGKARVGKHGRVHRADPRVQFPGGNGLTPGRIPGEHRGSQAEDGVIGYLQGLFFAGHRDEGPPKDHRMAARACRR